MPRFGGVTINLLHLLLALTAASAVVVGSVTLLPEEFIDYGIMAGMLGWAGFVVVSQWSGSPLRRALCVVIASMFLVCLAFLLWPFDSPM